MKQIQKLSEIIVEQTKPLKLNSRNLRNQPFNNIDAQKFDFRGYSTNFMPQTQKQVLY